MIYLNKEHDEVDLHIAYVEFLLARKRKKDEDKKREGR